MVTGRLLFQKKTVLKVSRDEPNVVDYVVWIKSSFCH